MAKDTVRAYLKTEKRFVNFATAALILLSLYCIAPFILMLSVSLSSEGAIARYGYQFWPKQFSTAAYDYIWTKRLTIGNCYVLSIFTTVVGTALNVFITSIFAYPLSRKDFRPRNVLAFILFFTVLFNGGLTASYIVWTQVFQIKNTIWALLLPGSLMQAMSVLITRNYYSASIPYAIIESAQIDGAGEWKIYTGIMVPLSKPVLTTIGLFAAIGYWNNWTNGLYYITESKFFTLQVYLQRLMNNIQLLKSSTYASEAASLAMKDLPTEGARMAIAIIALIPILMVYPFVQKQLIKGMIIGGVKG